MLQKHFLFFSNYGTRNQRNKVRTPQGIPLLGQIPSLAHKYKAKYWVMILIKITNNYNLNAYNKALSKTSKSKLEQLQLALLNHLLRFIIVNRVIIFNMLPKYLSNKLGFIQDLSLFSDKH
jgi:hypothetical protein